MILSQLCESTTARNGAPRAASRPHPQAALLEALAGMRTYNDDNNDVGEDERGEDD